MCQQQLLPHQLWEAMTTSREPCWSLQSPTRPGCAHDTSLLAASKPTEPKSAWSITVSTRCKTRSRMTSYGLV